MRVLGGEAVGRWFAGGIVWRRASRERQSVREGRQHCVASAGELEDWRGREREGGMGWRDVPLSEMVEEDDSGRKQE